MSKLRKLLECAAASGMEKLELLFDDFSLPSAEELLNIQQLFPARPSQAEQCADLIAEWFFFLHCAGYVISAPKTNGTQIAVSANPDSLIIDDFFLQRTPFGKQTPVLAELLRFPGSVAAFPLASEKGSPQIARFYVWAGKSNHDHKNFFCGSHRVMESDTHVFCSKRECLEGNSWQLAAELAMDAYEKGNPADKRKLAQEWIITGAVEQEKVCAVKSGNKRQLKTNRKWLVPLCMQETDECVYAVKTVKDAWTQVCGGILLTQNISLQKPIDEMHILAGESNAPIISCALQLFPQKVYLYYTATSENACNQAKTILQECKIESVECRAMPLAKMEELLKYFKQSFNQTPDAQKVVSITGGNRLMGFAAMLAARETNKMQMIYRDRGSKPFQLELLQYQNNQYLNGLIEDFLCPEPLRSKINWQTLYSQQNIINALL